MSDRPVNMADQVSGSIYQKTETTLDEPVSETIHNLILPEHLRFGSWLSVSFGPLEVRACRSRPRSLTCTILASVVFMSQLVPPKRKALTVYPVLLFYLFIGWMILIS
ncbi:hypothetical protein DYB32_007618 [Aphanomyces invadans]|uniref:Protein YIPF n=1 Tax=Aphanomyces invadans TaxID=157072 RepID=A0A3R6WHV1_9STRA|nr:hypothetical protein DYB32_007618 [Aphanomyces invadans]